MLVGDDKTNTAKDPNAYMNFMRVDPDMFHEMLGRLDARIEKRLTWMRRALDDGMRIAITLRYLASGDSYMSLMYSFRVSSNAVGQIVNEVCQAIIDEYAQEVIACPTAADKWREIADLFDTRWNF